MSDADLDEGLPSEDPLPQSSPNWLMAALRELVDNYPDGTTTTQRSDIGLRLGFEPRTIFGALSRRRLIAKPQVRSADATLRVVTADGHKWLANPPPATDASYSRYIAAVSSEMGRRAKAAGYPVDEKSPHVLARLDAWTLSLWLPLRAVANEWIAKRDRHKWIHNLRSSQAFAVNMLGPLKLGLSWAVELWRDHLGEATDVTFEFPHDGDPLGEMLARRSRTRIDVCVNAKERRTTLIEVKLTEPEFGACSSGGDATNQYRDVSCNVPFESFETLHRNCYLARDAGRDYFVRLGRSSSQVDPVGIASHGKGHCPLRAGLYQVTRNLLMAQHIAETKQREARVLIVAPGEQLHPILHKHRHEHALRDELRSILKQDRRDEIDVLAFEDLISKAEDLGAEARSWVDHMTHWYVDPLRLGKAQMRNRER